MKGAAEVTLLKKVCDDDCDEENYWYYWYRYLKVVLSIGGGLAVTDVTFTYGVEGAKTWFRELCSIYRGHRLRAPIVVGLVALRGRAPLDWRSSWKKVPGMRGHPQAPDNPIRCIAICLRVFLADKRITVACVGARDVAEKLAEEWEVHVARPAELTDMFARAFGKAAGVEPEKEPKKWWMSKAELRRARAKAEAEKDDECDDEEAEHRKQGKRPAKVVSGRSLERMARVALGPEMRLARCGQGRRARRQLLVPPTPPPSLCSSLDHHIVATNPTISPAISHSASAYSVRFLSSLFLPFAAAAVRELLVVQLGSDRPDGEAAAAGEGAEDRSRGQSGDLPEPPHASVASSLPEKAGCSKTP
ncbi:hypothetical protein GUJ93_ZPchr0001g29281 [Zizania palustris]|uniref:Uncharacterized protein n=1 Tax=Zizania palustris TaxID=103762 RepID=A0A8J5V5P3_ZIZPA|nr:hypothetical protein GUJ93_ZPchr0001g29281 [Zizania palustris]